ncbi:asparagine synthase (glutamine-hydrolyzing) [Microvirga lenta]|uniref:asparagine synthase (glutamine-hydrolyzing) n=1 Tax=Microvirga lenta TaxID=2881337 RepID=UPI001CFD0B30|nr:asparagine synthase (glutamine-hydrolyzing) [Microvirga lenta]MCB5173897.1 asparagine synthase (glutamine-hydrolyzing) [Microvirga lenta]
MCGIAGFLFSSRSQINDPAHVLQRMTTSLVSRGPDDEGHWLDVAAGVALGHRRLSIIDLSPAGHQPMASASGRYVLTFNGEIYNHLEIREELRRAGFADSAGGAWRGTSDTESLLAAIEAWGIRGALHRCVGMFALALWDKADRSLTLARDRLGEKPLYYGHWGGMFVFASELKALHAIPGFSPSTDHAAVWHYFCQKAVPAPLSIYEGIRKLGPGQVLTLPAAENPTFGNVRLDDYWSLQDALRAEPFRGSAEDAVDELRRLMLQSIASQMVADVPVGAFLSGGIDSSTVVALMQSVSDRKVQTYSIGFEEADFNEAAHAAQVANHLGTQHKELTVTAGDALAMIPKLANIWDEPFADSSQIPTALLTALARREVTVALSGDGGDELFCGYKRQLTASAIERLPAKALLSTLLLAFGSSAAQNVLRSLPVGQLPKSVANRLRILSETLAFDDPAQRYMALAFQPDQWTLVLSDRREGYMSAAAPSLSAGRDMLSLASAFDTLTYLPTDILAKVDRAAMAVGLETRVPLLDHRIVEFAFSLPSSYKVRGGRTKWPLRRILEGHVPTELTDRPKMGFSVPIGEWLKGPLRSWAGDLLFAKQHKDEFLNTRMVENIWRDHQAGRWNYEDHLWRVLMFRAWQTRYE